MADPRSFVQQYGPLAAQVGTQIGVAPDVLLGKWGLETGWGKSVIPGTNNLGNIKGAGVAAVDNMTGSNDQYKAYATPSAFGSDYASLLQRKYPGAVNTGENAQAFAAALQKGGYAEDPQYASKVTGAVNTVRKLGDFLATAISGNAQAAEAPNAQKLASDPLWQMLNSGGKQAPTAAPDAKLASDPTWQLLNSTQPQNASAPVAQNKSVPVTAGNAIGATLEPIATLATGALAAPIGGLVRLGSAALGNSFEGAKSAGERVSNALTYHPETVGGQQAMADFGNALGSVKDAIMNSPVGNALSSIGKGYTDTFVKGAPNALMATINDQVPVVTANVVASPVMKAVGDVVAAPLGKALGMNVAPNKLANVIGADGAPQNWPMGTNARPTEVPKAKPHFTANGDGTFTPAAPRPATPAQASEVPVSTPIPTFTAPELPKPKSVLSNDAQADNIAAMRAVGLDSQRPSAITGDKFTAGQEFQQSKLDSPMGEAMREQLAKEQAALRNYGQSIIQKTGAVAESPEAVGQTVRAPLQGLSDHYDNAISQLYQAADQRAAGVPNVQPSNFGKLLDTNSAFAGKAENSSLRRGINAYTREQGIVDADGALQPITVQQAEGLRQYLNSQWSPQNSGLIGKIKEALDTDVTKAGGDDIYASARALHAERKNTLDNPKGISSLLNESGPNGINQAVPDEKVAAKIMSMPTGQLSHIVDTLNNLPESLAPQGQKALAEMKGAFAKQIYKAGDSGGTQNGPSMWNAANVTKQLNAQASRISILFSPDEIAQFQTLNNAGHILQTPSAYPGAAVQGHNLLQRGMILAPPAMGASLGHAIGGIPGMTVGSAVGTGLAGKMAQRMDMANANKLKAIMANPKIMPSK